MRLKKCKRSVKLIAEEDVLAGGHEFHSIHVHLGRSGPLGICLYDLRVNVLRVEPVTDEEDNETQDQNNH